MHYSATAVSSSDKLPSPWYGSVGTSVCYRPCSGHKPRIYRRLQLYSISHLHNSRSISTQEGIPGRRCVNHKSRLSRSFGGVLRFKPLPMVQSNRIKDCTSPQSYNDVLAPFLCSVLATCCMPFSQSAGSILGIPAISTARPGWQQDV